MNESIWKWTEGDNSLPKTRAIVCYVDDNRHIIQQFLALRRSWLFTRSPDTDLVAFGPEAILRTLPVDVVKIPQNPASDDAAWRGYKRVNSITCFNGAGSERLVDYSHIMRTDVDTFITPGWNSFYPDRFTHGKGGYSNNDDVRRRIEEISFTYGLIHRGAINVGSTWYGPTDQIRRACGLAEMMAKHIITFQFAETEGKWPGWYRGVSVMYAGEIAVNHCAPDAATSELLETASSSKIPITDIPHIHCWHTDRKFSKHWFMGERYSDEDLQNLDLTIVPDYCMQMSFDSLKDMICFES